MITYLIELEGYRARIERSKDGTLYGRVIGLEAAINFKATTARVVERQFASALQAYFQRCLEQGTEPKKPPPTGM